MRHNKLKALNCKLKALLPSIQVIRDEMTETFDSVNFWTYYYPYGRQLATYKKDFAKLVKKLSTLLAKYAKINNERRKFRIFVKCTQFSIFN